MRTSNSRTIAERLVALIPESMPGLFNPWRSGCEQDSTSNGPEARVERLAAHLACEPKIILVGEAPGYRGCRYTGVAFTSERMLMDGAIPRLVTERGRLTTKRLPSSEQSSSIVWRTLYDLRIEECTVTWNALPMHPHELWSVDTNRTPTRAEMSMGGRAIACLIEVFQHAQVVPVGRKAEEVLQLMGVGSTQYVRHPANGGAKEFRLGLQRVLSGENEKQAWVEE